MFVMEQKKHCDLKKQCLHLFHLYMYIQIQEITCPKFYKDWTQFLAIFYKMD